MLTAKFLQGRGRRFLSAEDIAALEASIARVTELPARHIVVRRGEPVIMATLLLDGMLSRYMDGRDGNRQLVAVQVPGDFVDLHGYPMKHLDHDIGVLTASRVALVPHARLDVLMAERPNLARMLWFSTLLDAAMHREWIFRLGSLDSLGRVAHFFCELHTRLDLVGLAGDGRFALPLTQNDLADACGITPVHVNRVLRTLRERGLLVFRNGEAAVLDRMALAAAAEFDPAYLYPGGPDGGDGSGSEVSRRVMLRSATAITK